MSDFFCSVLFHLPQFFSLWGTAFFLFSVSVLLCLFRHTPCQARSQENVIDGEPVRLKRDGQEENKTFG